MRCMIVSCPTDLNYWNEMSGISSHRFPQNEHRKQRWIHALSQAGSNYVLKKNSRICSLHFKVSDYYEHDRGKLRYEAVPCIKLVEDVGDPVRTHKLAHKNRITAGSRIPFTNISNTLSERRTHTLASATVDNAMTRSGFQNQFINQLLPTSSTTSPAKRIQLDKQKMMMIPHPETKLKLHDCQPLVVTNNQMFPVKSSTGGNSLTKIPTTQATHKLAPKNRITAGSRIPFTNISNTLSEHRTHTLASATVDNAMTRSGFQNQFINQLLPTSSTTSPAKRIQLDKHKMMMIPHPETKLELHDCQPLVVTNNQMFPVKSSTGGNSLTEIPSPGKMMQQADHIGEKPHVISDTVAVNSTQQKWIRYAGDIKDVNTISPETAKQALPKVLQQLQKAQVRVNRLKQQNCRLRKNAEKFKGIMAELQANNLISSEGKVLLQTYSSNSKLLDELNKVHRGLPYSDTLRSFASTLNFYSPKAYRFVRSAFNNGLPHEKTVAIWYRVVDGEPGVTAESMSILENKSKQLAAEGRELLVSLTMDEVAIRQLVEWNPHKKKFDGIVDYGNSLAFLMDGDDLVVAKEALVFMVCSVGDGNDGDWKVPVAYFLINGLKTNIKKQLVEHVLIALQGVGAKVVGFTFDGTSTNISVANALGCNLKVGTAAPLKTHFQHPSSNHSVYVLLDACHMLKLIRNVLASQPVLCTANGEARWEYILKLNEFQNVTNTKLAPKLCNNHVNFQNQKMKVVLAAQTLSKSVADAIQVLQQHDPAFIDSEATIEFINIVNNVFDIMNSMDCQASGFKRPLCKENFDEVDALFKHAESFLRTLTLLTGQPILQSASKTGFLGFLINMQSFRNMYIELVLEKGVLVQIRTYRFSQDHVETFFAAVRSKGGSNNNPSATQFKAAYKRLLMNNDVTASSKANCKDFGNTSILSVSHDGSGRERVTETKECNMDNEDLLEDQTDDFQQNEVSDEDDFMDDTVKDIAIQNCVNFIRKELIRVVKCTICVQFVNSNDVWIKKVYQTSTNHLDALTNGKVNFNVAKHFVNLSSTIVKTLKASIDDELAKKHTSDSNHLIELIEKAVEATLNLKLRLYCKNIRPYKESTRSKYTKLILFEGH